MAMTESNQTSTVPLSVAKGKKGKIFYEHGKDALALALSVANMQEEKALRRAERHYQPQVGKPEVERRYRNHASEKKKRLEDAKAAIVNRQAEAKKKKARSRKETKSRLRRGDDSKITVPEDAIAAAPRKRVSFA